MAYGNSSVLTHTNAANSYSGRLNVDNRPGINYSISTIVSPIYYDPFAVQESWYVGELMSLPDFGIILNKVGTNLQQGAFFEFTPEGTLADNAGYSDNGLANPNHNAFHFPTQLTNSQNILAGDGGGITNVTATSLNGAGGNLGQVLTEGPTGLIWGDVTNAGGGGGADFYPSATVTWSTLTGSNVATVISVPYGIITGVPGFLLTSTYNAGWGAFNTNIIGTFALSSTLGNLSRSNNITSNNIAGQINAGQITPGYIATNLDGSGGLLGQILTEGPSGPAWMDNTNNGGGGGSTFFYPSSTIVWSLLGGSNVATLISAPLSTLPSIVTTNNASTLSSGTIPAARMPAYNGDLTTSVGTVTATLKNTGSAGVYTKITTDAQGRVSAGTTLGIADIPTLPAYQPADNDLTNLASLNGINLTNLAQIQGISMVNSNANTVSFFRNPQGGTNVVITINTNFLSGGLGFGWAITNNPTTSDLIITNASTAYFLFQTNGQFVVGAGSGVTLNLGMLTNNTPGGTFGNGSFLTTTQGNCYIVSNGAPVQMFIP
jgi:hypothetical protein